METALLSRGCPRGYLTYFSAPYLNRPKLGVVQYGMSSSPQGPRRLLSYSKSLVRPEANPDAERGRPIEMPKGFDGIEGWLCGEWMGAQPERYDREEWTDVMLKKSAAWPVSAPDMGT